MLFSRVVNTGIRALIDAITSNYSNQQCTFIKQVPYKASTFSQKRKVDKGEVLNEFGMYYLVIVKTHNSEVTLISPCYLNLEKDKLYNFSIAGLSHIIVDVNDN